MKPRLTTQSGRALYALRNKNGGARVRNYQTGDGLETVLDEGTGEGGGRVDVSHAGVECEADERIENGAVRAFLPAQGFIGRTSKCHRGQPGRPDDH